MTFWKCAQRGKIGKQLSSISGENMWRIQKLPFFWGYFIHLDSFFFPTAPTFKVVIAINSRKQSSPPQLDRNTLSISGGMTVLVSYPWIIVNIASRGCNSYKFIYLETDRRWKTSSWCVLQVGRGTVFTTSCLSRLFAFVLNSANAMFCPVLTYQQSILVMILGT